MTRTMSVAMVNRLVLMDLKAELISSTVLFLFVSMAPDSAESSLSWSLLLKPLGRLKQYFGMV